MAHPFGHLTGDAASTGYRWLGVDHVFLTDNNSENGTALRAQLESEFPANFLTTRLEVINHGQLRVFSWCAWAQRHHFNWLAFIDVDEFLVIRNGCASLLCAR
jgi:hypothetical protein